MMPRPSLFGLILVLFGTASFHAALLWAEVYATPEQAQADPDFSLQGEYNDGTRGLQAIALGEGAFNVVVYTGGLPGAGWNGKDKQSFEVDTDGLESLLERFRRVERTSPTLGAEPPPGAVVLFDGTKQSVEQHWKPGAKITDDGLLMEGCMSTDTFGDYSMHLEFRLPFMPDARGQGRGNSGLYHQGRYETQILDSFGLEGKNNEAGGLYSIRDPDLNMCLPPMVWQTYDVDFTAARYDQQGKKTSNAKITVKLNGVVVHRDVELPKSTTAAPIQEGPDDGPIYLQDHGNPVRFRNIWVLPRNLAAEARRPIVPAFERFHGSGQNRIDGGYLLLGELNCIACHQTDQNLRDLVRPKQAPLLDKVGERLKPEWMVKFIANPHAVKPGTTMPQLMSTMTASERKQAATAITNFLVGNDSIQLAGGSGDSRAGERLFHESGCVACHAPQDDRQVAQSTSIPLVDLGDKYTRTSLEAFLKNPLAVRPSGRMPRIDLGGDNWRHVAQYLTGDTSALFSTQRELPKEPNLKYAAYFLDVDQLPDLSKFQPDKTGVARGLDISVGQRDEQVVISFQGFLPVPQSGQYTFRLSSDDGSCLILDGKKVIDNDGIHPNVPRETTLDLQAGTHDFRVDYFEKSGEQALSLDWAGPGVKAGPIDKALVMTRDASPVPNEPAPAPVDPDAFVFDASQVEPGRQLFSSLGCAACHLRSEQGSPIASSLRAPDLAACDPAQGCLANSSTTTAPVYDLSPLQTASLAEAIRNSDPEREPAAPARLAHTLKALNCFACHVREGQGGPESDRNLFFVSTIPEMGDEGRLPPPLDGVGDKLRQDWIDHVVSNGDKSRPYMRTYMPGFGNNNVGHLAPLLAELDAHTEAKVVESEERENRQVALGRKMVGATGLGCVSCHTYGQFKATGIQAIALDTMTKRIREDWFHRYLPNPQRYRPGTRMPSGYPEGKSTVTDIYDGDPAKQIAAMWAFLEKGDKGGVPEGITGGMIELKAETKPVIYRNFIEGVSPRGIAVGYPEKANLCWDANTMSLALIWQDRFLDASKHWVGRGPGNQTPLGGNPVLFESVTPVATLASQNDPWPSESARARGYRFLGYRLDQQGRPTFRYRTPQAVVEDKPIPVAGQFAGSFSRRLTITPQAAGRDDARQQSGNLYFRAASGRIEPQDDGSYLIDGTVRIHVESSGQEPLLRTIGGTSEILVPVDGKTTIQQQIVW